MSGVEPTETVVPVVEEALSVGKRAVEVGRVRVALTTDTVEEVLRDTLQSRRAEIERRPVGETVTEVPRVRQEGDVLIIPVVEEVLVIEKRLVLREEVHVRLRESEIPVEHVATRRVQRATVERLPPETTQDLAGS
jgi:stress response protein YsnF